MRQRLLERVAEAQHLVIDVMFVTHGLDVGAGDAEVLARHFREEVVLDVEVQPSVEPVHEAPRVDVHVRQDLVLVPADAVELVHRDEGLGVVTEDELEVEETLDGGKDRVERCPFAPRRQAMQHRDHPRPVQHDAEPLVPAPLDAVAVSEDLVAADGDDERHESDVLDLDEEVLYDAAEQWEQLLVLRPRQLPHLRVDKARRHVDGIRHNVVDDVLVVPPVRAHPEADRPEDDAQEAVSEGVSCHRFVHAVVHNEATLLEEERDENRPEHVRIETVETEHGGESRPEYTHSDQGLDRVEPVIRLEEAALGEVPPELLEVDV